MQSISLKTKTKNVMTNKDLQLYQDLKLLLKENEKYMET